MQKSCPLGARGLLQLKIWSGACESFLNLDTVANHLILARVLVATQRSERARKSSKWNQLVECLRRSQASPKATIVSFWMQDWIHVLQALIPSSPFLSLLFLQFLHTLLLTSCFQNSKHNLSSQRVSALDGPASEPTAKCSKLSTELKRCRLESRCWYPSHQFVLQVATGKWSEPPLSHPGLFHLPKPESGWHWPSSGTACWSCCFWQDLQTASSTTSCGPGCSSFAFLIVTSKAACGLAPTSKNCPKSSLNIFCNFGTAFSSTTPKDPLEYFGSDLGCCLEPFGVKGSWLPNSLWSTMINYDIEMHRLNSVLVESN